MKKSLELLAPAKNLACGIAAIDHGADAVYIGAERFGARVAAGNSVDDIAELCRYAHQFDAKVYVTVNTLIKDDELESTRFLLSDLKEADVDAILVQDMAVLEMCNELGLTAHASTQTDNRTAEKVAWLYSQGFQRVVLARELSLDEISKIHQEVPDVELEVFVHGALCVSYSGQCYASEYCFNRSANRGECAQFCRMKFDLLDAEGKEIVHQRHLLSLKDLCQIDYLEELAASGACSFKIEGRLKDVDYVKNVVSAYSKRLDDIVKKHPKDYKRASKGCIEYHFTPDLRKTFNRGYTNYFLHGRKPDIASFDTPKAIGEYVGKVKEIRGRSFNVAGTASFVNGDGLCFFNTAHELEGFRVNRVEGNRLFPFSMPQGLKPGMSLYRNNDVAYEKLLSGKTAERRIPITMILSESIDGFVLTIKGDNINSSASIACEHQQAEKPQHDNMVKQLTKLGNTPYICENIEVSEGVDKYFIPSSLLTDLRRKAVDNISIDKKGNEVDESSVRPNSPQVDVPRLSVSSCSYLNNVSNHLAEDFYKLRGVDVTQSKMKSDLPLMQCRHCLRYSLGYCVKHGGVKPSWKEPLVLRLGDNRRFRLQFDCKNCQMNVYAE